MKFTDNFGFRSKAIYKTILQNYFNVLVQNSHSHALHEKFNKYMISSPTVGFYYNNEA